MEGNKDDEDDVVIVEVRKAAKPVELFIKKEILDDDDDGDAFYGFSLADIPRPIIIKVRHTFLNYRYCIAHPECRIRSVKCSSIQIEIRVKIVYENNYFDSAVLLF